MAKKIVIALMGLVLFFAAVTTRAESQVRPRRFIFLVHGLTGSEATFGYLPEALRAHAKVIQPTEDLRVIPLKYDTGSKYSTYHFAHLIARDMKTRIGILQPTDRITLIAHSQGGLISLIWYMLSLGKENGFAPYYQMAVQTEGLMTLGSPIWGAKPASFMSSNGVLTAIGGAAGMGATELGEMSFGSDTIYRFRQRAKQMDQAGIKLPLRLSAVGGVLYRHDDPKAGFIDRQLLKGSEVVLGAGAGFRAESDLAVTIPSARFDFIYLKAGTNGKSELTANDFTNFNFKDAGNFKVVEAPHFGWNMEKFFDMAEVPFACTDLATPCTHPTFPLILKFTMACTPLVHDCNQALYQQYLDKYMKTDNWTKRVSPPDLELKEMKSFMLDIVMNMPEDYELPGKRSLRQFIEFPHMKDDRIYHATDRSYFFRLDRTFEFESSTARVSEYAVTPMDMEQKQMRLTLNGHVYKAKVEFGGNEKLYYETLAKSGFKLPLTITVPGFKPRKVEVMVKPTYSTFIDLDYRGEKYNPELDPRNELVEITPYLAQ